MKNFGKFQALALVALVFGTLTVFSGGRALFGDPEARAAVGNAIPFVLWFNFSAGFAYVITGIGLWRKSPWSQWAATAIAASTALVGLAFIVEVLQGTAYEMRTAMALLLRLSFWTATAVLIRNTRPAAERAPA